MAISQKSIKVLWSNAAGLCAFPSCSERLAMSASQEYAAYTIGEMAHICGEKPGSNRHDPTQSVDQRDDYENLILLCPTHHSTIDKKENEPRFPVGLLKQFKSNHEAFVQARLTPELLQSRQMLAKAIAPLLAENHQAWLSVGPHSEIARKNPHSDSAYSAWLSERLSTIVPNNRRISAILRDSSMLLLPSDRPVVAAFLQHARSYDRWVSDKVSYESVQRFPKAFSDLIDEAELAST